jgi:hypothetical protein
MVGSVCCLANPVIVKRIARLRCDDIFILTINSRFTPGRPVVTWDAADIHDRKFVPAHKLFTTMSSDEFKMGKKIPLLVMRRGIKCDIQKLDSQLLNNIA